MGRQPTEKSRPAKMSRATLTAASSPLRLNVSVLDLTAFTNADSQGALFALVDN